MSTLPGVERAATVFPLPLGGKNFFLGFAVFLRAHPEDQPGEDATQVDPQVALRQE